MNTTPAAPTVSDERVIALIAQLTTVPRGEIQPSDDLRSDLGLDSVASMELVGMLSDELGVEVELEDAVGVDTVAQVIALVNERRRG